MEYSRMSKTELASAARDQGIEVKPFVERLSEPTRLDYLNALVRRGNDHHTSLLDLPAELRNAVYRELLLTSPVSRKCHPAILRTCRHIHAEAESILYGDNIFQVALGPHSIDAHGIRCDQDPVDAARQRRRRDSDEPTLDLFTWPEMLRKAQQIRVVYERQETLLGPLYSGLTRPSRTLLKSQLSARFLKFEVRNAAVYSLCAFLAGNHSLLSYELDLHGVTDYVDYASLIYPLTMLGHLQEITIRDPVRLGQTSPKVVRNSTIHRPPQRTADIRLLREAQDLSSRVQYYDSSPRESYRSSPIWKTMQADSALRMLFDLIGCDCDAYDHLWERKLEEAMETVRRELKGESGKLVDRLRVTRDGISKTLQMALQE